MGSTAAVVKMAAIFMLVLCVGSQLQLARASNDDQLINEAAAAGSVLLQKPMADEQAEVLRSVGGFGCSPACSRCKAACAQMCSYPVPIARCLQNCISKYQCGRM